MVECNICYNDISYGINCFGKCKIVICHNCFMNLLKLNDSIEYCCPQCRHTSFKNKDKRFTKFINKNKKRLEKVVQLFEEILEQTNSKQFSSSWEKFNRRVGQETYHIVYFNYDFFIPDN